MIERLVSDQIQVAAERSGNLEPLQSAYRVGHSTKDCPPQGQIRLSESSRQR